MNRLFLPAAVCLVAASAFAADVTAVTSPVGFFTIAPKASTGGGPTYLSLGMARATVFQAIVPASPQGASTQGAFTKIIFPTGTFTAGQFNGASGAHYLEILNGAAAGTIAPITDTTNDGTASTILLQDDITSAFATDGTTTFRVRPNWTFATAFGATNSAGFKSGTSTANADVLKIVDPLTGPISYYYSSSSAQWVDQSGNPSNNVAIPAEAGIEVVLQPSSNPSFKLVGDVKTGPTGLWVQGDGTAVANILVNPYPLASKRLKDSGLYTGSAITGVAGGISASSADTVRIEDPVSGQINDFYYQTTPAPGFWKTGFTDASLVQIAPGSAITVIRKNNRPSFVWYMPSPAVNLAADGGSLPLVLEGVVSRKTHGSSGRAYDINLPLTGASGVEGRTASGGTHSVVFLFSNPMASASGSLTGGGSVTGTSVSGNEVTVSLSGVPDVKQISVTLSNATDVSGAVLPVQSVAMRTVLGDANGSGNVSLGDYGAVKASQTGILSLGTFRADVNRNNTFSLSDYGLIKANFSHQVP